MEYLQAALVLFLVSLIQVSPASVIFQEEDLPCEEEIDPFANENVTIVGSCGNLNQYTRISIRPQADAQPLIHVCHDETHDETLWANHIIRGASLQNGTWTRSDFRTSTFYRRILACFSYKNRTVHQSATAQIGLEQATRYFHTTPNSPYYLAKGHLAPNADMVTQAQRDATFFFINACPMWQIINNGNWAKLEREVRDRAILGRKTLEIITGTFGRMQLPNNDGLETEIWIGRNRSTQALNRESLPVNSLIWKIVHDPTQRKAAVIIMLNNPYESDPGFYRICPDVCPRMLQWVTWTINDITRGYTYCCDVATFRQTVNYAPNHLDNLPLLTVL